MLSLFQKKPFLLGVAPGLTASALTYIEAINESLRLGGALMAVCVSLLTAYAKILEIRKHKKIDKSN